jgi:hypothetical protein
MTATHLPLPPSPPEARPGLARRLLRKAGVDRAVGYNLLYQVVSFVARPVSLFMTVAFLTIEEQGFQYTFASVLGLKVFFELGLGIVIVQFAGHEAGRLVPAGDGTLTGDPVAKARLGSLLRKQTFIYAALATSYAVTVLLLGWVFFSRSSAGAVVWQPAWAWTVVVMALYLPLYGVINVLIGCGQVAAMARLNVAVTAVQMAVNWAALAAGAGLLAAPAGLSAGLAVNVAGLLCFHRRLLADLWRTPPVAAVHWRREVWPLQWKISVSWLCTYVTTQVFNPLVFEFYGPAAAARVGLTLALAGMLQTLGWSWVGTRLPAFAGLVARRDFGRLDATFFRALAQATAVVLVGAVGMTAGVAVLGLAGSRYADRFLTPGWVAVAAAAAVGWHLIDCLASYFHCYKQDPFLVVKLACAAATIPTAYLLCRYAGSGPMLAGHLAVTVGVGLGVGLPLFLSRRRAWQSAAPATVGDVP